MEQFTELTARVDFTMKQLKGRPINVKIGDKFLVTNPNHNHNSEGIKIDRKQRAKLNSGYLLTIEQVNLVFVIKE